MTWPAEWPLSKVPQIRAAQEDEGPGRCFGCGAALALGEMGRRPMCCGDVECGRLYQSLYSQHRRRHLKRREMPAGGRVRKRRAYYVPPVTLDSARAAELADDTFGGGA